MKFIVIGLGNLGASLGMALVEEGHEVIGVDNSLELANALQDDLTHTICMDTTNENAMRQLPVADADHVIVTIGEDIGASIMTIALLKKLNARHIIGRAISALHQTVLEVMRVDEIIHPEADYAHRLANRFTIKGALDAYNIGDLYEIVEIAVPAKMAGKTILEAAFRQHYQVNVVTILRQMTTSPLIGQEKITRESLGVISPDTVMRADDVLVLFGKITNIEQITSVE
mgnify:CR=1 FL=1